MQVDVQVVLKKLQDRLGEALSTIAVLEAQNEALQAELESRPPREVLEPEVVKNG